MGGPAAGATRPCSSSMVGMRQSVWPANPAPALRCTSQSQIVVPLALDALEGVADPTLTISVRAAGEADARRIEVTVRDNGAGMDEATRARAFEPFFTTKPIGRGTGLGLSIAFGAVQSHGGSIDIESAGGEGTSVVVRLPLADRPR